MGSEGKLFIVSGPSGVGKTVLCSRMMEVFRPGLVYSISATSRSPRGQEKDGQDYFFYTPGQFEEAIRHDQFAEWAQVHGNYYGTPRTFLDERRSQGLHVLLNIDVQGALKIRTVYPSAVLVFILPPSLAALEERIRRRNTDSEEVLRQRLEHAQTEMSFCEKYDHSVINDDLDAAALQLEEILRNHIQSVS